MHLLRELKSLNIITKSGAINKQAARMLRNNPQLLDEVMEATNFLRPDDTIRARLFALMNGITTPALCLTCNKHLLFNPAKGAFNRFCPVAESNCSAIHRETRKRQEATVLDRYGVTNAAHSPTIRAKTQLTNIARYGYAHPMQSKEVQLRHANTMEERYGVSTISELPSVNEIRKATMQSKYGTDTFAQSLIPATSYDILKDSSRLKELSDKYTDNEIATMLSCGVRLVKLYRNKHNIKRRGRSELELEFANFLTELGISYVENDRSLGTELDFLLPTLNLAFELNGIYFHSQLSGNKSSTYHVTKTNVCEANDIQLVHILSSEWISQSDVVKSRVASLCGKSAFKLYARDCKITMIDTATAKEFLSRNHSQGYAGSSVKIGAYYDDELVAVMTFATPRFNKTHEWELIRFASKLNTNVVGIASKLLRYFIREHHPKSIVSYCDRRWGNGGVYKALGFTEIGRSDPNYWYFKVNSDTNTLFSRVKFQKHKLDNLLEVFDPDLTEWENMTANGYVRIWYCGNLVFSLQLK